MESNLSQYTFTPYKKDNKEFCINVDPENMIMLTDFNDLFPLYNKSDGLHLKVFDKKAKTSICVPLNTRVTNALLMKYWDSLPDEKFKNLSDEEYDQFMNDYVNNKTPHTRLLISKIFSKGFENPSIVQSFGIIPLIQRKNVAIQFLSGNGKTMTFLIGLLWNFDINDPVLQYIFMTNSHEVAKQMYDDVVFIMPANAKIELCIGRGVVNNGLTGEFKNMYVNPLNVAVKPKSIKEKMEDVRHAQIIVGTPGKINEYFFNPRMKCINPKYLKAICVDEFDNLLIQTNNKQQSNNLNTADQVITILDSVPPKTQKVFFSATIPDAALSIISKYLVNEKDDPFIVLLSDKNYTLEGIKQYYIEVRNNTDKTNALFDIISRCRINQCIIFTNRIESLNRIKQSFKDTAIESTVAFLHGNLSADKRKEIHENLKKGTYRYVVATNIIARGLDISGINLVINYDMPDSMETYIHRIGRSGRYGRKGVAISFVIINPDDGINELMKVEELNRRSVNNIMVQLPNNLEQLL